MDIKEIALKVADSLRNKIDGISHMQSNQGLVAFAEALIAELAKQNEPVAYATTSEDGDMAMLFFDAVEARKYSGDDAPIKLYTVPPTVEQLAKAEQRVAEACALQVATETKFHWLDAARVAKEIRSGEWRKFVKEV